MDTSIAQDELAPQTPPSSLLTLFRAMAGDVRTLLRQELRLVRTEITEKLARMGKNAALLVAGGALAYAAFIILFLAMGWLLAWAYRFAGLSSLFAVFLGMLTIGLFLSLAGGLLALKGLLELRSASLKPERTLDSLQELAGRTPAGVAAAEPRQARSSEEIRERVKQTESRMSNTLEELGRRMNPERLNLLIKNKISNEPYKAGAIAMLSGLIGGLLLRRRFAR